MRDPTLIFTCSYQKYIWFHILLIYFILIHYVDQCSKFVFSISLKIQFKPELSMEAQRRKMKPPFKHPLGYNG